MKTDTQKHLDYLNYRWSCIEREAKMYKTCMLLEIALKRAGVPPSKIPGPHKGPQFRELWHLYNTLCRMADAPFYWGGKKNIAYAEGMNKSKSMKGDPDYIYVDVDTRTIIEGKVISRYSGAIFG